VSFSPTAAGSASNAVVFTSNGGNATNIVTGLGLPVGEIAVAPAALNFGYVAVGAAAQASFLVTNVGGGVVTNVAVSVDATSPFTLLSGTPFRLAGFSATNVIIQFAPANAGSFGSAAVFLSDGGNRTNGLTGLGAFVPAAGFSASPTLGAWPFNVSFTNSSTGTITNVLWDFGDGTTTNDASPALTHTYTNPATNSVSLTVTGPVGTNTLTRSNYIVVVNPPQLIISPTNLDFGAVATGRTNAQSFQLVNVGGLDASGSVGSAPPFYPGTNGFIVGPGQTGYVSVAFSPASLGILSNVVIFAGNGGNFTNPVTGTGITPAQLSVSPPGFDFGTLAVGSSAQATLVATNLGQETLTAGSASIDGGPFTILSGAAFSLAGSGSTNITVSFAPTDSSSFSNVLVISTGNAGNSTNSVTGSGAFVPLAGFTANPTSGSWPLTVIFSDTSSGTITNRFWDFGDGSQTNTQSSTVTRNYSGPGVYNVSLTVSGPVGSSTVVASGYIVVTNLPPMLVATPANLDFGPLIIGQSRTQVFAVYDPGQLVLNGSLAVAPPFSVAGGTPFSVPLGQTGLVQVVFSPIQPGTFSGNAVFTSNGGNATNGLSGTGLAPSQIFVFPPNLDFGVVAPGASVTASLLVTNLGDITASNITVSVGSGPFSVLTGSPFNLPADSSTNVQVRFAPASEGTFSNSIVFITDNAGNSTNTLTGSSTIPLVAGFSASPTTGNAPLAVNFADVSTGSITNRFWNFGDGSTSNTLATNITHIYQVGGTYTVKLTVYGAFGGSNSLTRAAYINSANVAPTASFVATPPAGSAPFPANFTDASVGTITNRFWDFGDGSTTNTLATQVTHFYAAGNYRVKLTVTGPLGSNTKSRNNYISVTNAPAKLLVTPASLNFGGVAVGRTNTAPFQVINLGSFSLSGTSSISAGSVFSLAGGSPFTLNGGQTSVVLVAFSPDSTVNYSTNVVFTSSAGNSINIVAGSGLIPAQLVVTPPSLDFGTIAAGSSAQATFVLTNQGAAVLSNGVAITSGPFTLLSGTPFSLAGFGSTNLLVSFAPTDAGSFSNVVVIISDGGNSTNSLAGIATGPLIIAAIRVSGSDVVISFLSSASATYSLEYTDTLAPTDWKTAVSPIPGNGDMVTATHFGGAAGNVRFYRIRQIP
jgi:PKD repeat protein